MPVHILKMSCPDRPGIVAAVSGYFYQQDCNIIESAQFEDPHSGRFFMRTVFATGDQSPDLTALTAGFAAIGLRYEMDWSLVDAARRSRMMILVSRFDHCLVDLLYRTRIGQLHAEVVGIVSNHPRDTFRDEEFGDIPFHHLPVTAATKPEQEDALFALIEAADADLVVLARYMQILSPGLSERLAGRAINIHHSFLPGFKGAKPYQQAYARGVKLIGATAHYVTPVLDDGPIIEQAVERIDHRTLPEDMVAVGRDIEKLVLARAVQFHTEHRILLNGQRTVVFR